jgi:hypothetical protein
MGRFVIVAYSPKPSTADALVTAVHKNIQVLRVEDLVTDRPADVMRAADGTVVEVFERWSAEAIAKAQTTAAVQALRADFSAACDYRPLNSFGESPQLSAEFEPVAL